jgi:hypothetical protein
MGFILLKYNNRFIICLKGWDFIMLTHVIIILISSARSLNVQVIYAKEVY